MGKVRLEPALTAARRSVAPAAMTLALLATAGHAGAGDVPPAPTSGGGRSGGGGASGRW